MTSVYVISAHESESLLSLYQKNEGQFAAQELRDGPNITKHDEIYRKSPEALQIIED